MTIYMLLKSDYQMIVFCKNNKRFRTDLLELAVGISLLTYYSSDFFQYQLKTILSFFYWVNSEPPLLWYWKHLWYVKCQYLILCFFKYVYIAKHLLNGTHDLDGVRFKLPFEVQWMFSWYTILNTNIHITYFERWKSVLSYFSV